MISVFWALILFNPQPLDGILNSKRGTLFDHYGRNLEGLKASAGDVLQKTNDDLILIFDDKKYFQMQSMDPEPGRTKVQCHLYPYPPRDDNWPELLKKVRRPNNLGVTFALATKFTDKYLPFHPVYCNKRHYMHYILYGEITKSEKFKDCPLAAPLASVTVGKIKYKCFKLMDSDGKRHDFSEFTKSNEQRLFDKIESVKRTERHNSWYQHGSPSKSMLRDIFMCWGIAIKKSSSETIFIRVKLKASNGRPPLRYRIELVDKFTLNEAASFMHKHYSHRNNLALSLVCESDDEIEKMYDLSSWVAHLKKRFALAAFLEDEQGKRGPMIGCNVLELIRKDSNRTNDDSNKTGKVSYPEVKIQRSEMDKLTQTHVDLKSKVDVFTLYKCSSYVEGAGLAVAANYGGRGIATELLRARGEFCRMVGTPVSVTLFDGAASQKAAEKCGYKTLSELDLRTYRINGQIVYLNPQTPVIKYMGKRYY